MTATFIDRVSGENRERRRADLLDALRGIDVLAVSGGDRFICC